MHELELLEGVGAVVRLQSEAQTDTVSQLTDSLHAVGYIGKTGRQA